MACLDQILSHKPMCAQHSSMPLMLVTRAALSLLHLQGKRPVMVWMHVARLTMTASSRQACLPTSAMQPLSNACTKRRNATTVDFLER